MPRPWDGQQWVLPYRAAVFETNLAELAARVSTAESAIKARIADTKSPPDEQELDALQDALRILFMLDKGDSGEAS